MVLCVHGVSEAGFIERQGTQTVPEVERGGVYEGPDVVTWLQMFGTDTMYELPRRRRGVRYYTLGAVPDQDIAIPSPFVSARHCRLVRTPLGLRVVDEWSKNGIYFEGKRRRSFYLEPGETFFVGARAHRVLALNDQMHAHHPALAAILGYEDERTVPSATPSPSELIVAAVAGSHMLITSEPHCDQDRLAHIVHAISLFRDCPLVPIGHPPGAPEPPDPAVAQRDLAQHQAATVLLDLENPDTRLEPALASRLFSPRYQTRVIALARTIKLASAAIGERYVQQMKHVRLEPLSRRPRAIHRLLDQLFAERGSSLRVRAMAPHNQAALARHRWAQNFASLREAADRLVAIARETSLRRAAHALGVPPATFHNWYSYILRLSQPLLAEPRTP